MVIFRWGGCVVRDDVVGELVGPRTDTWRIYKG